MQENTPELIKYMEGFVSERRKGRLQEVLAERTRHMTVVLEDVYQAHNASAVLRSCDCFGVQDVHFIENKNKFKISEVRDKFKELELPLTVVEDAEKFLSGDV